MLEEDEFLILQERKPAKGNQALIAAGTGLGEAGLFWQWQGASPFCKRKRGHSDFAPRDELEMELLRYLKKQFGHVSYEVISGNGFYLSYPFLFTCSSRRKIQKMRKNASPGNTACVITEFKKALVLFA